MPGFLPLMLLIGAGVCQALSTMHMQHDWKLLWMNGSQLGVSSLQRTTNNNGLAEVSVSPN